MVRRVLSLFVILVFFGYVFFKLFDNLDKIKTHEFELNPFLMILGISLESLVNTLSSLVWGWILIFCGLKTPDPIKIFVVWELSRFGRYIPGKIWMVASRLLFFSKEEKSRVLWATGIENVLDILAGLSLAFLGLFLYFKEQLWETRVIFLFLFAFWVLSLNPYTLNFVLRKITKENLGLKTFYGFIFLWFLFYLILWLSRLYAQLLFFKGFGLSLDYWIFVASFSISWVVGLLTPFSPGGIGVREGLITYILEKRINPGFASLIALLSRICSTISDIVVGLISLALYQRKFKTL